MTYTIKEFGPIKKAQLKLRPLTVLCGQNNTGKSYITYSLYALLDYIKNRPFEVFSSKDEERDFLANGQCVVNLTRLIERYKIQEGSQEAIEFTTGISDKLKLHNAVRSTTKVSLEQDSGSREFLERVISDRAFNFPIELNSEYAVRFVKHKGKMEFRATLEPVATTAVASNDNLQPPQMSFLPAKGDVLRQFVPLARMLVQFFAFKSFIFTCERTGVSTFRSELNMLRDAVYNSNRRDLTKLLQEKSHGDFDGYSMPIEQELTFALNMASANQNDAETTEIGRKILPFLQKIVGGSYQTSQVSGGSILYVPEGSEAVKLKMMESSSSVRTLSELYFYLRNHVGYGETLFIDEPELNLHPSAQRMVARLIVRLVNEGLKVFVTTHSDYIIRELNALTRMAALSDDTKLDFLSKHGYEKSDLISGNDVGCYIIKNGETEEMTRDVRYGFAVKSFDDTIESFNALYNDLCDVGDIVDERNR